MIVAFTGAAGCGKDTAALHLVAEHGFTKLGFADPLREMMWALDPIVVTATGWRYRQILEWHGYDRAKRRFPEIRQLVQRLGTEAGRQILGESIWVDLAMQRAADAGGCVVFADCRFHNEAVAVRDRGGVVIRLERRGAGTGRVDTDSHVSEAGIDPSLVDATIRNDRSIGDLYAALDRVLAARAAA